MGVQAHGVEALASDSIKKAGASFAAGAQGFIEGATKMYSYYAKTRAETELKGIRDEQETLWKTGLEAAPGTALSWLNEDGSPDEEKLADFYNTYQEKYDAVNPVIPDMQMAAQWQTGREDFLANNNKRLAGQLQLHTIGEIKRVSRAALDECKLNEDDAGVCRQLDDMHAAGILTAGEVRVEKLRWGNHRVKRDLAAYKSMNKSHEVTNDMLEAMQGEGAYSPAPADGWHNSAPAGTGSMPVPPGDGTDIREGLFPDDVPAVAGDFPDDGEPVETPEFAQGQDYFPASGEMEQMAGEAAAGAAGTTAETSTVVTTPEDELMSMPAGRAATMTMTPEEVQAEHREFAVLESRAVLTDLDGRGRQEVVAPDTAPEEVQAYANAANEQGGIDKATYKQMCYAAMNNIVTDEQYNGLSDADMVKLMVSTVTIEGLEHKLFDGNSAAYLSFMQDIAGRIMSTRNDEIDKRLDEVLNGKHGLPGINEAVKQLDDVLIAEQLHNRLGYTNKASAAQAATQTALAAAKLAAPSPLKLFFINTPYLNKAIAAQATTQTALAAMEREAPGLLKKFQRETGVQVKPDDKWDSYAEKFRTWYLKPGGEYDKRVKDYVKSVKDYCRISAIDAVIDYRRGGGNNWAEESQIITAAVKKAKKECAHVTDIWANYRAKRQANLDYAAQKYRQDFDAIKPQMDALKQNAAERKAVQESVMEEVTWDESAAKAQRKKAYEQAKEGEERITHPYRFRTQQTIRFKRDDAMQATVTIPAAMYNDVISQLGAHTGQGLFVKIPNKRGTANVKVAVKAGDDKHQHVTMNLPAIHAVYGKNLTAQEMGTYSNPHAANIQFILSN